MIKFIVVTVNMADGTEYQMDAVCRQFGSAEAMYQWADDTYPGWSSLVVTVLP